MEENQKGKKRKERPKYNLWQNSAYMIRLAWEKRKSVLVFCGILIIVGVAQNLTELFIAPVILRKVEDAVPLQELVITILAFTLLLLFLQAVKGYVAANTIFGRIELRVNLLLKINEKAAVTSYPNMEDAKIRKKWTKALVVTDGNNQASEAIWETLIEVLESLIGFCIYLCILSTLDIRVMALIVVTALAGYFISERIYEWDYRHKEEEEGYLSKLEYIMEKSEDRALAKDIRIFGMKAWLDDVYDSTMKLCEAFSARREKMYIWANVADVVLAFLRNGAAYAYLITMVLEQGLSVPAFLLYFNAVSGFSSWITEILKGVSTLYRQSLDLNLVREYLELPEQFVFEGGKSPVKDKAHPCEIQLRNVSFRYPGASADTIRNMNLTIRAGEKLAVVGLNGAGKTTLVKLICGFYDPTEGEVLLNGEDIRNYNRREYYQLFSAVFQQFSVLDVPIRENVAQTFREIREEKVTECIEKAGLLQKVNSLPKGDETVIGRQVFEDGIELSGGEMQRLMLARALYKDAPIIVLDEPTAALDPIAEDDIYRKYHELTAGRTSVYISHRLASTRFCDRIILLEDGGICEEGSHEELLGKGGRYAGLYQVQSQYYEEGRNF